MYTDQSDVDMLAVDTFRVKNMAWIFGTCGNLFYDATRQHGNTIFWGTALVKSQNRDISSRYSGRTGSVQLVWVDIVDMGNLMVTYRKTYTYRSTEPMVRFVYIYPSGEAVTGEYAISCFHKGVSCLIHILQLHQFIRSLDGSTKTDASPKCLTLPNVLWLCFMTKHRIMSQVRTW